MSDKSMHDGDKDQKYKSDNNSSSDYIIDDPDSDPDYHTEDADSNDDMANDNDKYRIEEAYSDEEISKASGMDEDSNEQSSDDEYEKEHIYIVANMPDEAGTCVFPSDSDDALPEYAIIGMETDSPFLEINGTVFKGTYDELLGTSMVFNTVASNDGDIRADLIASTSKVINFQRMIVVRRE